MSDTPDPQPVDPGLVKYLRLLVTVLTAVLIVGFVVLVFLFVTRLSGARTPPLPEVITLPDGTEPVAFTRGGTWYAVVTGDDTILIFDQQSGKLRQTITIDTRP